jgi:uncharacterized protein (DUF1778 family)
MTSSAIPGDVRLSFRLPTELKQTIEEAAARLGQSVSEFAVSTLVRTAREVIELENITKFSNRDRDIFIALLDDKKATPNNALLAASQRYKKICV